MNHAIEKEKEIKANILKMYSNTAELTTKEMSVEDFQKSYPADQFSVITNKMMESYCKESVDKINANEDKIEKAALIDNIAKDINAHESIIVKAENGTMQKFFVKKKELIEKSEDVEKTKEMSHDEKSKYHATLSAKHANGGDEDMKLYHAGMSKHYSDLDKKQKEDAPMKGKKWASGMTEKDKEAYK